MFGTIEAVEGLVVLVSEGVLAVVIFWEGVSKVASNQQEVLCPVVVVEGRVLHGQPCNLDLSWYLSGNPLCFSVFLCFFVHHKTSFLQIERVD